MLIMSINITLLRNIHGGLDNARLLEPYIEACDILSYENAAATIAQTSSTEAWLARVFLGSEADIDAEFQTFERRQQANVNQDPEVARYLIEQTRLIYQYRKPILLLERNTPNSAKKLKKLFLDVQKFEVESRKQLITGNLGNATKYAAAGFMKQAKSANLRDQNMLDNLRRKSFHDLLIEQFPDQEDIKYLAIIGHGHQLSDLMSEIPGYTVEEVDLNTEVYKLWGRRIIRGIMENGANYDGYDQHLSKALAASIVKSTLEALFKANSTPPQELIHLEDVCNYLVRDITHDSLKKLADSLHENPRDVETVINFFQDHEGVSLPYSVRLVESEYMNLSRS